MRGGGVAERTAHNSVCGYIYIYIYIEKYVYIYACFFCGSYFGLVGVQSNVYPFLTPAFASSKWPASLPSWRWSRGSGSRCQEGRPMYLYVRKHVRIYVCVVHIYIYVCMYIVVSFYLYLRLYMYTWPLDHIV